jgi:hypothetical protein
MITASRFVLRHPNSEATQSYASPGRLAKINPFLRRFSTEGSRQTDAQSLSASVGKPERFDATARDATRASGVALLVIATLHLSISPSACSTIQISLQLPLCTPLTEHRATLRPLGARLLRREDRIIVLRVPLNSAVRVPRTFFNPLYRLTCARP